MSDYISKSTLVDSIMKNVLITTEEGFELRGEIVDLIKELPTLDEKEIIRKCGEQIVDKLKNLYALNPYPNPFSNGRDYANIRAINLVKEECGINE